MRQGDSKIFEMNKENLYRALNLRRIGWSFSSIATHYGCDRTTVENQCAKYGIVPGDVDVVYSIETIIRDTMPEPPGSQWVVIGGERINRGRSYKDYFKGRTPPQAWVTVSIEP